MGSETVTMIGHLSTRPEGEIGRQLACHRRELGFGGAHGLGRQMRLAAFMGRDALGCGLLVNNSAW
jgi:hypothetical protein